ncbi:MAG: hypothetical protein CMI56_02145 [Parcubacteria group bacterium]|nr:hypothetical protein [Parcubacteria group bacterium]|tara:strand:- start:11 stop:1171 length:1161 start_codon:yes stop_codon:yes gene_type:complete
MLTITHTNCASTGELLDRALDTIEFYGFDSVDHKFKGRKINRKVKQSATPTIALQTEKKLAAMTKSFVSHKMHRDELPNFSYQLEHNNSKISTLGLYATGSRSAITEGVLIATLATIARDSGLNNTVMHINSIGDKESSVRFVRDLTSYLRTHINDMPTYAREEMQNGNIMRAFTRLSEKNHEIVAGAPNSMEYLNDESRAHLRSVLEFTENMGVPYELDPTILGSTDCWQHTIFELRVPTENGGTVTLARGGRHDTLALRSFRTVLPMVSAIIEHEIQGRAKPRRRTQRNPRFFFAQLGPEAKRKSFTVIERLREADIPIRQQVAIDSIGIQLENAEKHAIPYTIIIGHKEALENTAIVRNMRTRSQAVVPLANLASYLKRLKVS